MPRRAFRRATVKANGARIVGFAVGSNFWLGTTLVRIERVEGPDTLLVRELPSERLVHVRSGELRAATLSTVAAAESGSTPPESYRPAIWERAQLARRIVEDLESLPRVTKRDETRAARALGISARHLRRWRVRYRALGTLEAFLPQRPGRSPGTRSLSPRVEALVDDEVRRAVKRSADIAIDDVYPLIVDSAKALRLRAPARSTVARRLADLKRKSSNFDDATARALELRNAPVRGRLSTETALSVVQMDHTLADVIIVDPVHRKAIGRPWLTLALDVHTRMILGMLLSLEAPGSLSVSLALDHAVYPKDPWASEIGLDLDAFPAFGLMNCLHLDNGPEFRAHGLARGCQIYGIELDHRPVGNPRFGGAIERVIGTMMGKVKLLPGATFSRVLKGRPKHPERRASFTLADLTLYLARQVGIYHHTVHGSLGMTPRSAWEQALRRGNEIVQRPIPDDRRAFAIHFLPSALRAVGREGIRIHCLRYQSRDLEPWIEPGRLRRVRYDPRDLSRLFLETDEKRLLEVPISDRPWPPASLWEWREIRERNRGDRTADAQWAARAQRANQALIDAKARGGTARDRRRRARGELWSEVQPPKLRSDRELTVTARLRGTPLYCEVLK
jgi:putative transposase